MENEHFKNITLQQMEAVVALVKEGSFSRAAKIMLLTQPALTKNIKNIENYLGAKIVNRSKTGVSLTPEGKIIYDYALRMVKLRSEAQERIHKLNKNDSGYIYVSASTIPATYILPRVLSEFRKSHPGIMVYIRAADSEVALNMVLDNEVAVGCIGKKPMNSKLIAEPLWPDRLILVAPANHHFSKKKAISLTEMFAEPFILREKGSATRELMEFYLKTEKLKNPAHLNVCCELGSSEAVKEAVLAGLGVSVISISAVERELSQGLLFNVPLHGCRMERNFYLIYRRHADLRPAHKIFIEFLKHDAKRKQS